MAARLKGLLQRHGRVLFTGGMAHWSRIEALLAAEGLRPSVKGLDMVAPMEPGGFRRAVIDPALAVAHMDITARYRARRCSRLSSAGRTGITSGMRPTGKRMHGNGATCPASPPSNNSSVAHHV